MRPRRDIPDPCAEAILGWYDRNRRRMPWRAEPGAAGTTVDPYRVWLSEIMLQQTTVATVGPYFERFVARWPDIAALAAADLDEVLHAWRGLGYYARARNLHRCAGVVARDLGGRFPEDEATLRALPGIGRYTAAAVAAIAFDRRATVVDGNVERVIARLFRVTATLPGVKERLYTLADSLTPMVRPGDYAQAVMDLGATVCTPRGPRCASCPWSDACAGRDIAETLPRRQPRKARPMRRGIVFWLTRPDGAVLLRRRPESGLLGGMIEVPSTDWVAGAMPEAAAARHLAPVPARRWRLLPGVVRHGFTHFRLELAVLAGAVAEGAANVLPEAAFWCPPGALDAQALPTLFRKVAAHALAVDC